MKFIVKKITKNAVRITVHGKIILTGKKKLYRNSITTSFELHHRLANVVFLRLYSCIMIYDVI